LPDFVRRLSHVLCPSLSGATRKPSEQTEDPGQSERAGQSRVKSVSGSRNGFDRLATESMPGSGQPIPNVSCAIPISARR
jgi:hypothetical protein